MTNFIRDIWWIAIHELDIFTHYHEIGAFQIKIMSDLQIYKYYINQIRYCRYGVDVRDTNIIWIENKLYQIVISLLC